MSSRSTSTQYGSVAIAIHWSSAVAVVIAFIAGMVMANSSAIPPALLVAHIALGLLVFALTLFRIAWWWWADKQPPPPAGQPRWQQIAAKAVHGLLYVLLILMATSGIATIAASGAIGALAAGGALPDFSDLIPRVAHGVMARLLLLLLVLHVGAALYHQFIRLDRLLARMGIGRA